MKSSCNVHTDGLTGQKVHFCRYLDLDAYHDPVIPEICNKHIMVTNFARTDGQMDVRMDQESKHIIPLVLTDVGVKIVSFYLEPSKMSTIQEA